MRSLSCIILATILLTSHAADKKPEFTLTAEEMTREFKASKDASKKYKGKLVEVTGAFHARRPGDVLVLGHREGISPNFVSCTPTKEAAAKHQRLHGLARGQKVTFRGVAGDLGGFAVLGDCELASVGPNPAIPVTLSKFKAMFAKPADAKKNDGKPVIARVRIIKIDTSEKSRVVFTVADAATKTKLTAEAFVDTYFDADRTAELKKVKTGETWYVLGVADNAGAMPRFWDATLLKVPPEGVKMPGVK